MRVVIINSLYPPVVRGGAEKSVSLLAEGLVNHGDQVAVISLYTGKEEVVEMRNGVRVYRLPLDNAYWPFGSEKPPRLFRLLWHIRDMWNRSAARRIGRILDLEKPEVVHTNNIAGFSVSVWNEVRKRGIRLVHTLRDYHLVCARYTLFRNGNTCNERCFMCKLLTCHHRRLSSQLDAVVSNSQFVLNSHTKEQFFVGVPSSVIFNIAGSDLERPARPREDSTLVFGFIGRIEPEKGIEVVLEASKLFSRQNWRLRVAGTGLEPYVASLKTKYPDGAIEWLGFSDSKDFYSSIDVCIVSSVWPEPLPRTLLETFAAGKSAICANSGGIPEIASFGKNVKSYPARDPQALANIVNDALNNVSAWRDGGWRDTSARIFTEAYVVSCYLAVYKKGSDTHGIDNLRK